MHLVHTIQHPANYCIYMHNPCILYIHTQLHLVRWNKGLCVIRQHEWIMYVYTIIGRMPIIHTQLHLVRWNKEAQAYPPALQLQLVNILKSHLYSRKMKVE